MFELVDQYRAILVARGIGGEAGIVFKRRLDLEYLTKTRPQTLIAYGNDDDLILGPHGLIWRDGRVRVAEPWRNFARKIGSRQIRQPRRLRVDQRDVDELSGGALGGISRVQRTQYRNSRIHAAGDVGHR